MQKCYASTEVHLKVANNADKHRQGTTSKLNMLLAGHGTLVLDLTQSTSPLDQLPSAADCRTSKEEVGREHTSCHRHKAMHANHNCRVKHLECQTRSTNVMYA